MALAASRVALASTAVRAQTFSMPILWIMSSETFRPRISDEAGVYGTSLSASDLR